MNKLYPLIILILSGSLFFAFQQKERPALMASQFYTDSIFSHHLGEYRKHNVYLPKGFDREQEYPIIYAPDGTTSVENSFYNTALDSLIDHELIQPVIFIASHSNSRLVDSDARSDDGKKLQVQYRNYEYVEVMGRGIADPDLSSRFERHLLYFKEELMPQVEKELNQTPGKENRFFYGFSNGAGFGANLLNKHPELMGTYLCFSTLGSNVHGNDWDGEKKYPDLYLLYGDEEEVFFQAEAKELARKYTNSPSFVELKTFKGGHDYMKWREGFVRTISKLL